MVDLKDASPPPTPKGEASRPQGGVLTASTEVPATPPFDLDKYLANLAKEVNVPAELPDTIEASPAAGSPPEKMSSDQARVEIIEELGKVSSADTARNAITEAKSSSSLELGKAKETISMVAQSYASSCTNRGSVRLPDRTDTGFYYHYDSLNEPASICLEQTARLYATNAVVLDEAGSQLQRLSALTRGDLTTALGPGHETAIAALNEADSQEVASLLRSQIEGVIVQTAATCLQDQEAWGAGLVLSRLPSTRDNQAVNMAVGALFDRFSKLPDASGKNSLFNCTLRTFRHLEEALLGEAGIKVGDVRVRGRQEGDQIQLAAYEEEKETMRDRASRMVHRVAESIPVSMNSSIKEVRTRGGKLADILTQSLEQYIVIPAPQVIAWQAGKPPRLTLR